jgi:hypothetical protein
LSERGAGRPEFGQECRYIFRGVANERRCWLRIRSIVLTHVTQPELWPTITGRKPDNPRPWCGCPEALLNGSQI